MLYSCTSQLTVKDDWTFCYVQSTASNGKIIACSEAEASNYDEAEPVNVELTVTDNEISLYCSDLDKTYAYNYTAVSETSKSAIYDIATNDGEAYMTASYTITYDGTEKKTLVVSLGDYALYFTAA